jgi:hypothetical protein
MRSFRTYALSAVVFAIGVTAACALIKPLAQFLGSFDALVFIPIVFAVGISGNPHAPPTFLIYLGLFVQWLLVGMLLASLAWWAGRLRSRDAS